MVFKAKTKTLDETQTRRRVSGTAPLVVPEGRHVPSAADVRHHWLQLKPGGPIPAVGNLFGDATGNLLQGRLDVAGSTDEFLAVADEARAYGEHEIARMAVEAARTLAVREQDRRQIEALQAAMQPSELERVLGGF